ncbi:GH19781 [Drosophila grimshawi]|uniref:trypsin n=2 Tax=Drosophila grimshawi TaxID=7222 RepID=B4J419_DROGR|nr:GH19781 [Drosophila grimshawi]
MADNRRLKLRKRLASPIKNELTDELGKYVVSIRSRRPQIIFGDNHYCGGAIIAPRYVLTAAKCSMNKYKVMHPIRSIVVVGGTANRLKEVDTTVTNAVKKIFVPDNFTLYSKNNIAILLLEAAWPTDNPRIDIIKLPDVAPNYNDIYMVLGWGRMYKGGPLAANLVHIDVKLLDRKTCLIMLKGLYPEMLCAGNFHDELDSNPCAGDTGDPMIRNNTLIGIVSHRVGCGTSEMPSIYTDVWYHTNWIKDTMQNMAHPFDAKFLNLLLVALIALLA